MFQYIINNNKEDYLYKQKNFPISNIAKNATQIIKTPLKMSSIALKRKLKVCKYTCNYCFGKVQKINR